MPQPVRQRDAVQKEQPIASDQTGDPARMPYDEQQREGGIRAPTKNLAAPVGGFPGGHGSQRDFVPSAALRNRSICANIQSGSSHMMKWLAMSVT